MFDRLLGDVRYALRWLRRSPGFAIVAIVSFAIGIGFNTAIFSVVDVALFRPLPVERPDRLVDLFTSSAHERYATSSYPDFMDLKTQNSVFEDMVAYSPMMAALNLGDRSRIVMGEVVTGNYFKVLGVPALVGRTLQPSDDVPGAERAVMVSEAYWRREMAGDRNVVGRQLKMHGLPYIVVGVVPERFTGMVPILAPEIWVTTAQTEDVSEFGQQHNVPSPTGRTRIEKRGSRWLMVKGRLKKGATIEQARGNVDAIMARLKTDYPQTNQYARASLLPTTAVHVFPDVDNVFVPVGAALMVLVGLVLLVACANVAAMLLSRAAGRQREIAIRLAMGAGRGRLVQQLLTESFLLALAGGVGGVVFAVWLTRAIAAVKLPIPIPLTISVPLDGRALAFTAAVTVLAALLTGLVPALKSSSTRLSADLQRNRAAGGRIARRWTLGDGLVAAQIAITLVLLVCGGLLARSLVASHSASPGFRADGLAIVSMDMTMAQYDAPRGRQFLARALQRIGSMPGVGSVALASQLPFGMNFNNMTIFVEGHDEPGGRGTMVAQTDVGPAYFATLGIPLRRGRVFADGDTPDTRPVAIVNETMARRFWPGQDALGKIVHARSMDGPAYEVVGIVADHKIHSIGEEPTPYLHLAYNQRAGASGILVARTRGDEDALLAQMRRELLALEPAVVFFDNQTMSTQVAASLFPVRAGARLVSVVGLVAMLLAAVGLYGLIAYSLARRTREIGVRLALGARPAQIVELVMKQGLTITCVGLAAGALLAMAMTRLAGGVLYGVSAADPVAWTGAALTILLVSALANLLPARRAARVDPTNSLRAE